MYIFMFNRSIIHSALFKSFPAKKTHDGDCYNAPATCSTLYSCIYTVYMYMFVFSRSIIDCHIIYVISCACRLLNTKCNDAQRIWQAPAHTHTHSHSHSFTFALIFIYVRIHIRSFAVVVANCKNNKEYKNRCRFSYYCYNA